MHKYGHQVSFFPRERYFVMPQTDQEVQWSETGQGEEGNAVAGQSLEPELEEEQEQCGLCEQGGGGQYAAHFCG